MFVALVPLILGCGTDALPREGQLRVYVTTDAVLPLAGGALVGIDEPVPMFDRVRFDLYLPGDAEPCPDCGREFAIDRAMVDEGRASIGVIPKEGSDKARARVRLFRSQARTEPEPRAEATLDATVVLPSVREGDLIDVTVELATAELGHRMGTPEVPVEAALGRPRRGWVGTWPGARRVACALPPKPGEVCIPGGAFWMGDPLATTDAFLDGAPGRQRLVVISPFYLDAREMTFAEIEARLAAVPPPKPKLPPSGALWSGRDYGVSTEDWCNANPFGTGETPIVKEWRQTRGQLPANCVRWVYANAVCAALGSALPTSAQLEYAASGLRSSPYVWGDDNPTCKDAVFARGGMPGTASIPGDCRPFGTIGGPLRGDRADHGRDVLELPTGTVYDLTGNVAEWSLDFWNRSDEPCWADAGIYVDPLCQTVSPADGAARGWVGGDWYQSASGLAAGTRRAGVNVADPSVGFRCARPAEPAP